MVAYDKSVNCVNEDSWPNLDFLNLTSPILILYFIGIDRCVNITWEK